MKTSWMDMSMRGRMQFLRKNVSVEPLLMFVVISRILTMRATDKLYLEKVCRVSFAYDETVCDMPDENVVVELHSETARIFFYRLIVQNALPCLLIMFWGSWSDRHRRRKPCMLIPLVGEILASVGVMLAAYFSHWSVNFTLFLEVIFPAITGGWFAILMAAYSYIADITTEKERTFRIGFITLWPQIAVAYGIGEPLSIFFRLEIGFWGVHSMSLLLQMFALLYGVFWIRESPLPPPQITSADEKKSVLADFFDLSHISDTLRVSFKHGKQNRRAKVIMLMLVLMIVSVPWYGEQAVNHLLTMHDFYRLEIGFIYFTVAINTLGFFVTVDFLLGRLKLDDALVGIISTASKILCCLVYGLAVYPWQIYAGSAIGMLYGASLISLRSIASKLVSSGDLGKVNAILCVIESIIPMIYDRLKTFVDSLNRKDLQDASFLVCAITIPALGMFAWMYRQAKLNADRELKDSESNIRLVIVDLDGESNNTSATGSFAKFDGVNAEIAGDTE